MPGNIEISKIARSLLTASLFIASVPLTSVAEPTPPPALAPWAMPWGEDVPGRMSAASLLDAPAGKAGVIAVRDGHFFAGQRRIRFLGGNVAFSGALPTHEQADRIAHRLAQFGINCIRFHHMDNQPFPNGLFADRAGEKFSPEALDRLDYFIAALKSQGVYSDVNLHVSRDWARAHHWPNADKLPGYDKMVDVFNPELIAANKQYARELLGHLNPYTKTRLADEPAVAMIEINNEDTLFLWGGEKNLAELPEPYAGQFQALWNQWLVKKYGSREKLAAAWSVGAQPRGKNLIEEPWSNSEKWVTERHEGAEMTLFTHGAPDAPAQGFIVKKVTGTDWHIQFSRPQISLGTDKHYTLSFDAWALRDGATLGVGVSQAHQPWQNLGLGEQCKLTEKPRHFQFGFTAADDDTNARVSFSLGHAPDTIVIKNTNLSEGGVEGLADNEDPSAHTVVRGGAGTSFTANRSCDWYDFLQQTDEAYFVEMRRFLREEVGVKCPITGTIGLGPLGTCGQSKMDFVDAHAYWEHPHFPHRAWDSRDWVIPNKPMVDNPAGATLWGLAATRVAGKPFTVTEYNHSAPNEWQAECMPMIATYAALQDWDGIFLFAYSHNTDYEKTHVGSFFDVEGNPMKMDLMPVASRIFVGGAVQPLVSGLLIVPDRRQMLATGSRYFYQQWPFLRDVKGVSWKQALHQALEVAFDGPEMDSAIKAGPQVLEWSAGGEGTHSGRFLFRDPRAAVFVGFAKGAFPIALGDVSIDTLRTPFASIMLTSTDPKETIEDAHTLLLTAAARQGSTGIQWDAARQTVSDQWGTAPPFVEVVSATLSIPTSKAITVFALTPEGQRGEKLPVRIENGRVIIELGSARTIWYELVRE